jgi:hypothetical protein
VKYLPRLALNGDLLISASQVARIIGVPPVPGQSAIFKSYTESWECTSVVEHLPSMHKVLILALQKIK